MPIPVITPCRRPITRFEKDTLLQSAYEFFLYDEDIEQIDSLPIVLGYNNGLMYYVPTQIISKGACTEFKLGCVKELVTAWLNIMMPINTNLIPVGFLPTCADLRTSMLKYKSGFGQTEFTEIASVSAGAATGDTVDIATPVTEEVVLKALYIMSLTDLVNLYLLLLSLQKKRGKSSQERTLLVNSKVAKLLKVQVLKVLKGKNCICAHNVGLQRQRRMI